MDSALFFSAAGSCFASSRVTSPLLPQSSSLQIFVYIGICLYFFWIFLSIQTVTAQVYTEFTPSFCALIFKFGNKLIASFTYSPLQGCRLCMRKQFITSIPLGSTVLS
jgi:hypothetical protein